MSPLALNANHIAATAGGGFEPQRKNNFMVILTPPGGDGEVIELSLMSFPLHKETTGVIKIPYLNEERKVAGKTEYAAKELKVRDYVNESIAKTLLDWRRKVFDPANGKVGLASSYKVDAKVVLFAPDGTLTRTWDLHGVWPSAFDMGGGDMSTADPVEITCTLEVDWEDLA